MFEDWKRACSEAVENFQREVQGGDDQAPPRVRAMERELVSASGALARLDEEIRRSRREVEKEQEALAVCRRRHQLALDAGDAETVRVAEEFAARHEERIGVLTRKAAVLEDERSLLDRDISEMRRLVAEAAPRASGAFGGAAGSGSVGSAADGTSHGSSGSVGGASSADPLFDEEAAARSREFSRLERDARERAASERLEELKRRMQG
jgi:phage shock protein A